MFTIFGGKTEFNQWDLEQLVTCDCLMEGDEVVFSGHGKTYETTAFVQDGKVWADVPNFMLNKAGSFVVDLGWGLHRHMDCRTVFNVAAKAKPEDYVCPYNIKPRNKAAKGGVSSWNDLTDKPFYEEIAEITVIDNQTFEFEESKFDGELTEVNFNSPFPVSVIQKAISFDVVFDNVAYRDVPFKRYYDQDGQSMESTDPECVNYPFYFWIDAYDSEELYICIKTSSAAKTHTVTLVIHSETVHHIEPKYIKDMYTSDLTESISGSITNIVWGDEWFAVSAEFSDELLELFSGDSSAEVSCQVALVTINGQSHWFTSDEYNSIHWGVGGEGESRYFYVNIPHCWDGLHSENGELKCGFIRNLGLFGCGSIHGVSDIEFTLYTGKLKTIDDKYIPDSIARSSELNSFIGAITFFGLESIVLTSPSGIKFKLTVDDSGTVSAVEVTG